MKKSLIISILIIIIPISVFARYKEEIAKVLSEIFELDYEKVLKKVITTKQNAFSLAETMVVLVILGIIAIVVIPALVKKQVETTNRTKIKKAMAAYESVINQINNALGVSFGLEE